MNISYILYVKYKWKLKDMYIYTYLIMLMSKPPATLILLILTWWIIPLCFIMLVYQFQQIFCRIFVQIGWRVFLHFCVAFASHLKGNTDQNDFILIFLLEIFLITLMVKTNPWEMWSSLVVNISWIVFNWKLTQRQSIPFVSLS